MAVNLNSKYYTPQWLVNKTIETMLNKINNITEIIEPSAGDGAFIEGLENIKNDLNIPVHYYDLFPEHNLIKQQSFYDLNIPYQEGRVIIGNPPFGRTSVDFKKFVKKSSKISDYAVFICPASAYIKYYLPQYELIHNEYLGAVEFIGIKNVKVKCCLNIYSFKKINNEFDKIKSIIEKDIELVDIRKRKDYNGNYIYNRNINDYDYIIVRFGDVGKLNKTSSSMYGINIKNETLRLKYNEFLNTFYDKYKSEIIKYSSGTPSFIRNYLIEKIYQDIYDR